METKAQIRGELLRQRKDLLKEYRLRMEEDLMAVLKNTELVKDYGYFYAYYPHNGELSLLKTIQMLWDMGKRVALPRVDTVSGRMDFYEISSFEDLKKGSYGIMEPGGEQKTIWEEAVCLTPGVAFDRRGIRIGHGKGYYDKYFAQHRRLIRAGIAYDFQIREALPSEETDVAMEYLFTPSGCRKIEYQ